MLVELVNWLSQYHHGFHVLSYLTLRSILSALTALVIVLCMGNPVINYLRRKQVGQMVRDDGPQSHLHKTGTPTMGGILVLFAFTIAVFFWSHWREPMVWLVVVTTWAFGIIGFMDDYLKLILKKPHGLSAKAKYFWQSVVAAVVAWVYFHLASQPAQTALLIPCFKNLMIPLGAGSMVLTYLVVVGSSNAVNLTDGLDGLATLPIVLIASALGVFAYLSGHHDFAHYLLIPSLPGVGEVAVVAAALAGAGLGFLWFNTYPAMVFMGDVGSLSMGAALGCLAVVVRQELVLFIMGGVFVAETVSVMIQVASFRLRGKRVFRMAPLHHHFELKGWPEPRVIVRFWLITLVLVLIGLATLKVR